MSHSNQSKGISFTAIILASVVSVVLGVFFAQHWPANNKSNKPAYDYVGTVLTTARPVSPFSLTATDNHTFDNQNLKGKWTLFFFGFTNCPMMCPTAMRELAQTYDLLKKDKVSPLPQVVMVSVDPKRDSVERMKQYVSSFNTDFIGLVGDNKKIRSLSAQMGIAYEKIAAKDKQSDNYDFQHSGAVIVVNPEGAIQAFFNWPHKPSDMAKDYSYLVS